MNSDRINVGKRKSLVALVLLVLFGVSLIWYAGPAKRKMDRIKAETNKTERQIREQKDLYGDMKWMEQKMEQLPFRWEELPEYSNQKNEMTELKQILGENLEYGLEFQTEQINEGLMARDVTVTFQISGIEQLEQISEKIEHGSYPALIMELNMESETQAKDSCRMRIRYFEKVSK